MKRISESGDETPESGDYGMRNAELTNIELTNIERLKKIDVFNSMSSALGVGKNSEEEDVVIEGFKNVDTQDTQKIEKYITKTIDELKNSTVVNPKYEPNDIEKAIYDNAIGLKNKIPVDTQFMYIDADKFEYDDNPRDGNCLFHALVKILKVYKNEIKGDVWVKDDYKYKTIITNGKNTDENSKIMNTEQEKMRNIIIEKLQENNYSGENRAEIDNIKFKGGWGGDQSIQAFSNLYNICILVSSKHLDNDNVWITFKPFKAPKIGENPEPYDGVAFLKHTGSHYINAVPSQQIEAPKNNSVHSNSKNNINAVSNMKESDVTIKDKNTILSSINEFESLVHDEIHKRFKATDELEDEYKKAEGKFVEVTDFIHSSFRLSDEEKGLYGDLVGGLIDVLQQIRYAHDINKFNETKTHIEELCVQIDSLYEIVSAVHNAFINTAVSSKRFVADKTKKGDVVTKKSNVLTKKSKVVTKPKPFKSTDNVGSTLEKNTGKTFFIHPESTRYNNIKKFTGNAAVYSFGETPKHEQKIVTIEKTGGKSKKRGHGKKDLAKTRKRKTPRKQKGGTITEYTDFDTAFRDLKGMLVEKDVLVNKDIVKLLELSQQCDALRKFFSNYNHYKADENEVVQNANVIIPRSVDGDGNGDRSLISDDEFAPALTGKGRKHFI